MEAQGRVAVHLHAGAYRGGLTAECLGQPERPVQDNGGHDLGERWLPGSLEGAFANCTDVVGQPRPHASLAMVQELTALHVHVCRE